MDKWRYQEVPELSELQMKLFCYGSIAAIIGMSIVILVLAVDAGRSLFNYFSAI